MPEIETTVLTSVQQDAVPSWGGVAVRSVGRSLVRTGTWAGDTAQKFAALLSDLMGPAVFLAYAMTAWSLATELGWTGSFLFTAGPMSNWLVWLGFALLLNFAANILKRRTQPRG